VLAAVQPGQWAGRRSEEASQPLGFHSFLSERNAAKAVGREVESSDSIQAVGKDNSDACTIWFEKEVSRMNKDARFSQERKSGW